MSDRAVERSWFIYKSVFYFYFMILFLLKKAVTEYLITLLDIMSHGVLWETLMKNFLRQNDDCLVYFGHIAGLVHHINNEHEPLMFDN